MKVLATAYACDPRVGSEPGIGWNWVRLIASRYDCWLITRENNVELIEQQARAEGLDRLRVKGFDLPRWMRFWKRGPRGTMTYFYLWQLGLAGCARQLDREIDFDVVHHLTFSSSWMPSGLARVSKPFVWGPVGQHPRIPDRFISRGDVKLRCAEWLKWGARQSFQRWDPFVRKTVRSADTILSLGATGAPSLRAQCGDRVESILACGTPAPSLDDSRFERGTPFRVAYAGRLVDLKGVRLALEAFARAAERIPGAQFEVAGDGPLRESLEQRARRLGIDDRVRFHGHLSHEQALELMGGADLFLFPSFEGAGMVVVEAMARGCPVVCLDYGGPGEMVDDGRGVRVDVQGRDSTVDGLADAIARLYGDEPLRQRLARGAYDWASTRATWLHKAERLPEIYASAMERRMAG